MQKDEAGTKRFQFLKILIIKPFKSIIKCEKRTKQNSVYQKTSFVRFLYLRLDFYPSLSIVFGFSSKTQWLSGLYYADFISFYSPTQLCGGETTKSNSKELPISVPLSFFTLSHKSSRRHLYSKRIHLNRLLEKHAACLTYPQWQVSDETDFAILPTKQYLRLKTGVHQ